jgi:hypothetical protein
MKNIINVKLILIACLGSIFLILGIRELSFLIDTQTSFAFHTSKSIEQFAKIPGASTQSLYAITKTSTIFAYFGCIIELLILIYICYKKHYSYYNAFVVFLISVILVLVKFYNFLFIKSTIFQIEDLLSFNSNYLRFILPSILFIALASIIYKATLNKTR